jgi:hypothetical protein
MKTLYKLRTIALAAAATLGLTACPPWNELDLWEPIYMSRADLEASVKVTAPRELGDAGKIWVYGSQIFVCEKYKGVHVFDNSNPRNLRSTAFVEVPGCVDIAVKDSILFADNSTDLVAIDLVKRELVAREKGAFTVIVAPDGTHFTAAVANSDDVIVGFKRIKGYTDATTSAVNR